MSRCWAPALRCGKFVVELLKVRPLVVSFGGVVQHVRAGVRVVEFSSNPLGITVIAEAVFKSQTLLHGHRLQHHQRTPPTDELTTDLQQICHIAMLEPNISTCQDVGMWQIFVRWW